MAVIGVAMAWVDHATGTCRTDMSVGGKPTLTVFVEDGRADIVDHANRRWWSRDSEGVTCAPPTAQTIEQNVAVGRYALAGHGIVDGRRASTARPVDLILGFDAGDSQWFEDGGLSC